MMKPMHLEEINDRLGDLLLVLAYCSFQQTTFTTGQRICINQERGALGDHKCYLFDTTPFSEIRKYQVPEEIEFKIQSTLKKIEVTNWQAPVIVGI